MRRITEVDADQIKSRALRPYISTDLPTARRFLLREDGVEAGFVEVQVTETAFEVAKLVVARRFRGRGIGSRLLTHAESVAKREGQTVVQLRAQALDSTAPTTYELESWYRRLGYLPLHGPSYVHVLRKPL